MEPLNIKNPIWKYIIIIPPFLILFFVTLLAILSGAGGKDGIIILLCILLVSGIGSMGSLYYVLHQQQPILMIDEHGFHYRKTLSNEFKFFDWKYVDIIKLESLYKASNYSDIKVAIIRIILADDLYSSADILIRLEIKEGMVDRVIDTMYYFKKRFDGKYSNYMN